MVFLRPSWVEIDLGALRHNYLEMKRLLPMDVGVMAMVKADAYGHGAVRISKTLVELGVDSLCVATVEEGIELRKAGIKVPVLVMGGLMGMGKDAVYAMLKAELTPVIHSAGVLHILNEIAVEQDRCISIHLQLDTGMARLGVMLDGLGHLLDVLRKCRLLRLVGVMTHLSDVQDVAFTNRQLAGFKAGLELVSKAFDSVEACHIANSAAVIDGVLFHSNKFKVWVRPGILLYGVPPHPNYMGRMSLRPVMSIKSRIILMKHISSGTPVGYSRTYYTKRDSVIGVIPVGYGDGYPWSLSNKACVLIRGNRVPVVGSVTMDMIMVDLTELDEVHVGDEVVLLGRQGSECIHADELARIAGTISYEILCGISKRVPRVYVG